MSNFMKRTVPVLLVLVLCISCLVSPVSAESFDGVDKSFFNLLDYGTSSTGSNLVVVNSGNRTISYSMPFSFMVSYVDMVITTVNGGLSEVYAGRVGAEIGSNHKTSLNIIPLNSRCYRVFGEITRATYSAIEFDIFTNTSSQVHCAIQSLLVFDSEYTSFEETGYFYIQEESGTTTSYRQSEYRESISHNIYVNTNYVGSRSIQVTLGLDDWKKYDFVEFEVHADFSDITSIFAWVDDIGVPYHITYLGDSVDYDDSSVDSLHDFLITVDLRGVDRTGDVFAINIDGELPWAQGGKFGLGCVHGFIEQNAFDTDTYFFRSIIDKIELFRTNFFSVMASLQSNLSTWFTDLGTYLGDLIITLNNNMNAGITNLAQKLNTIISDMSTGFTNVISKLSTIITDMGTGFSNVISKLTSLITGTSTQNSNASDFNTSVEDQSSELEDMTDTMNSVTKPPLDDINMDVSTYVDPNVITVSTNGLRTLLRNKIIFRIFILSFTMALVGFILYGKK